MKARWEAVPQEVASAFRAVSLAPEGSDFDLAGGTVLALRLGHRVAVALDLFSPALTDLDALQADMRRCSPPLEVQSTARRTLHGVVGDIVVSFFGYDCPLLRPLYSFGDRLLPTASIEDIAAMKLAAIALRGARKGFLDVRFMVGDGLSLQQALELFERKLGPVGSGYVVRALSFFDDADREPEPVRSGRPRGMTSRPTSGAGPRTCSPSHEARRGVPSCDLIRKPCMPRLENTHEEEIAVLETVTKLRTQRTFPDNFS